MQEHEFLRHFVSWLGFHTALLHLREHQRPGDGLDTKKNVSENRLPVAPTCRPILQQLFHWLAMCHPHANAVYITCTLQAISEVMLCQALLCLSMHRGRHSTKHTAIHMLTLYQSCRASDLGGHALPGISILAQVRCAHIEGATRPHIVPLEQNEAGGSGKFFCKTCL